MHNAILARFLDSEDALSFFIDSREDSVPAVLLTTVDPTY
jgi:hypothetical protein